jgi:hypothetical protein
MKATKIMIGFLATMILTWLALATLVYLCKETGTFRQAATEGGLGMFMLVFGWIPSLIVSLDLEEKLL